MNECRVWCRVVHGGGSVRMEVAYEPAGMTAPIAILEIRRFRPHVHVRERRGSSQKDVRVIISRTVPTGRI